MFVIPAKAGIQQVLPNYNFPELIDKLLTQLSGFSEREMNNPLALCELAARTPNISAGHMI
ncbi:MAG: hypothetical protein DRH90_01135 [Deltaproteobacteria bacterium]|nr:MAG: hypothetical protein DRH90_01135 [Deltaproteobacteria bacterium]RLC15578.1 MAG: hypothetical protein DRI24_10600 [Deltaproteobacteria bacterium]